MSQLKKVAVSVLMTVYNGEKYLSETIESVLKQTLTNFEFIIVDDGSTDGTADILSRYRHLDHRITIITNEKNLGIVASVNRAIEAVTSSFIARIDCGDIAHPNKIELQFAFLCENSEYILVSSQVAWIDLSGNVLFVSRYPSDDIAIRKRLYVKDCILLQPSVMFRVEKNFFYRNLAGTNNAEDYDYWLRLSLRGRLFLIDKPLIKVRMIPDGTTYSRKIEQVKSADLVYESFLHTLSKKSNVFFAKPVKLNCIEKIQQRLFGIVTGFAVRQRSRSIYLYCFLKWISLLVSPYYFFKLASIQFKRITLSLRKDTLLCDYLTLNERK